MMLNGELHRVIPKLALPMIVSMLINSFYNMVDTFFVSMISAEATAAAGVNFSLMSIITAVGMAFGVGAGSYILDFLAQKGTKRHTYFVYCVCFCIGFWS